MKKTQVTIADTSIAPLAEAISADLEISGDLRVMVVGIDTAETRQLAVSLFELGVAIVVADPDKNNVYELDKVLDERSGSMTHYRTVPFDERLIEPVEVYINLKEGESIDEQPNCQLYISRAARPVQVPAKPVPVHAKPAPVPVAAKPAEVPAKPSAAAPAIEKPAAPASGT